MNEAGALFKFTFLPIFSYPQVDVGKILDEFSKQVIDITCQSGLNVSHGAGAVALRLQ